MNTQAQLPATDQTTQDLEISDKKPRRVGMIILLITFGLFGTWAALAPLDSASHAQGVVSVKGKRKTVQHFEGGIVQKILVSEGEVVEEGQPLIVLDSTQFSGDLGVLKGQFYSARALEDRLTAERDEIEEIKFSQELDVDDIRAHEAKRNQAEIFRARKNAIDGEREVLLQRVAQLESQIEGIEALVASQEELLESYRSERDDLKALLDEGFVEKNRVAEVQRNYARTRGEIADQKASIAQAKIRIGETRLEMLQLNKQLKTQVVDELATAQAEVFDLSERIAVLEDRVDRTIVRAPVSGIVLGMQTTTIGGVIKSGVPLLDIVPENQQLIVDAKMATSDIDRVYPGMEARIRFSAFNSRTTATIDGVVTKVSADRLVDEESGAPYYSATVEITDKGYEELGDLKLVAGMPAEVLIKTGERTLLEYLTKPAQDAMARSLIEE